jgi:hypothetical protein
MRRLSRCLYTAHGFRVPFTSRRWLLAFVLIALCLTSRGLLSQSLPDASKSDSSGTVGLQIIVVDSAEEAERILKQLKSGADFGTVAKEKSLDPTAPGGGYLGTMDVTGLRPELQEGLKGLQIGQITAAIKIPTGYAILKVISKTEPANVNLWVDGNKDLPLTEKAVVRYPPNTSGIFDVETVFRSIPKPEGWNSDPRNACKIHRESTELSMKALKTMLDPESLKKDPMSPVDQMNALYALAAFESYEGKMGEAIGHWQQVYQIAESSQPDALPLMMEVLGSAYYHKSEMENGIYERPGDRCIFPPRTDVPFQSYAKPDDSKKSIEYFLKYLEKKPDDLEVKWLLNIAYMTLGKYPSGVPAKYLIPPSAFASKEDIGRFTDVAPQAGIDIALISGAMLIDDFENNGLLDVIVGSYDVCNPIHYFHNNGDGTFSDRSMQSGLADVSSGQNMIQADYNNDGCMDILVLRGAWQFPLPVSLLKNNCDGTFTDVTREAGLGDHLYASQAAAWADIDNDGYVDLLIGNEQGATQLFHNRGDGTFENISHISGVDAISSSFTKGVVAEDYDHDGYPDFFLSNLTGDNTLFHNNGDLTFTNVADHAGVRKSWSSFTSWFFDYDNDGLPDLFVASYYASVEESMRTYLGLPHSAGELSLYKNLGDGTFRNVTKQVGLDKSLMPMGANFGDVDNDGYLDIYLGNGAADWGDMVPKTLLRNDEGKTFTDITTSSGTGDLHQAHGIAFADLENNGQEDIVVSMGGAAVSNWHALRLFRNPGNKNDWITLKLVGTKTNRAAIGARIKVTVENKGAGIRSIYRSVNSGGSFGSSPLEQHIGLGKSAKILEIDVDWPTSKTHQSFKNVAANQFLQITEMAPTYVKLPRQDFRLAGAPAGSTSVAKGSAKNAKSGQ